MPSALAQPTDSTTYGKYSSEMLKNRVSQRYSPFKLVQRAFRELLLATRRRVRSARAQLQQTK